MPPGLPHGDQPQARCSRVISVWNPTVPWARCRPAHRPDHPQHHETDFVATDGVNVTGAGGFQLTVLRHLSRGAAHRRGWWRCSCRVTRASRPTPCLQDSATPRGSPSPTASSAHGLPNLQTLLTKGKFPTPTVTITRAADKSTLGLKPGGEFQRHLHHPWFRVARAMTGTSAPTRGIADAKTANASATFKKGSQLHGDAHLHLGSVSGKASITVIVAAALFRWRRVRAAEPAGRWASPGCAGALRTKGPTQQGRMSAPFRCPDP